MKIEDVFNIGGCIDDDIRGKVREINDELILEGIDASGHHNWRALFRSEWERRQLDRQEKILSKQMEISERQTQIAKYSMRTSVVAALISFLAMLMTAIGAFK